MCLHGQQKRHTFHMGPSQGLCSSSVLTKLEHKLLPNCMFRLSSQLTSFCALQENAVSATDKPQMLERPGSQAAVYQTPVCVSVTGARQTQHMS